MPEFVLERVQNFEKLIGTIAMMYANSQRACFAYRACRVGFLGGCFDAAVFGT
jgi:hypothetical protein